MSRYAVQVGAFSVSSNAAALLAELAPEHGDAYIAASEEGGRSVYRVVVGSFDTPEGARLRERGLRAQGLATFVRSLGVESRLVRAATRRHPAPQPAPGVAAAAADEEDDGLREAHAPEGFAVGGARVRVAMAEEDRLARPWISAHSDDAPGFDLEEEVGLKLEAEAFGGSVDADALYDRQSEDDQALDLRLHATAMDGRLRAKARFDVATGDGKLRSWSDKEHRKKDVRERSLDLAYDVATFETSIAGRPTKLTATARHIQPLGLEADAPASGLQLAAKVGELGVKARHLWQPERTDVGGDVASPEHRTMALDLSFPLTSVLERVAGERLAGIYPYLNYRKKWVRGSAAWAGADAGRASADSIGVDASGERWSLSYWFSWEEDRGVESFWEPYTRYHTSGHDLALGWQVLPTLYAYGGLSTSNMDKDGDEAWSSMTPGFGLSWTPVKDTSLSLDYSMSSSNDSDWGTRESYSSLSSELAWPLHLGRFPDQGIDGRLVLGHDFFTSGYEAAAWDIDARDQDWAVNARVELLAR